MGQQVRLPLGDNDPSTVGGVRLVGRIGEGGSGVVYEGIDESGQRVAVKVLHADLAASADVRERLRREAAAMQRVPGARTAQVHAVDPDVERPYIVMDLIEGETLAAVVQSAPLRGPMLVALAEGLIDALEEIHAAGILHRDLKPSNVLFGPDGVQVVDFGVSALEELAGTTRAGAMLGTPAWTSPEQATGATVGPTSDLFNLGMVIAYAATGQHPFGDGRPDAMLFRIVHQSPNLEHVPASVNELVSRSLAKDPEERPSLNDLRQMLGASSTSGSSPTGSSAYDDTRTVHAPIAAERRRGTNRSATTRRRGRSGQGRSWSRAHTWLAAVLSIALLASAGLLAGFRAAPDSGPIVVYFQDVTRENGLHDSPTLMLSSSGEHRNIRLEESEALRYERVADWRLGAEIEFAIPPVIEPDEEWSAAIQPAKFHLGRFGRYPGIVLDVTAFDEHLRVIVSHYDWRGTKQIIDAVEIARGDVGAYLAEIGLLRDETRRRQARCTTDQTNSLRRRLRDVRELNQVAERAANEHYWNTSRATYAEWSRRIDRLIAALIQELPDVSVLREANEPTVHRAAVDVLESYSDLYDAWNAFGSGMRFETRNGSHDELYPREWAALERSMSSLRDNVRRLDRAISSAARTECAHRHPLPDWP